MCVCVCVCVRVCARGRVCSHTIFVEKAILRQKREKEKASRMCCSYFQDDEIELLLFAHTQLCAKKSNDIVRGSVSISCHIVV